MDEKTRLAIERIVKDAWTAGMNAGVEQTLVELRKVDPADLQEVLSQGVAKFIAARMLGNKTPIKAKP